MTLSAQVGTTTHAQQTACMPAAAIVIALTDTREERTPDRRPERHFFRSACKDFLRTLKIPGIPPKPKLRALRCTAAAAAAAPRTLYSMFVEPAATKAAEPTAINQVLLLPKLGTG